MTTPIELEFISAARPHAPATKLVTFNSYSFERSITTPATAFRFTAPGVDRDIRLAVRSGDMVQIFAFDSVGKRWPLAVGIIDETDTHVTKDSVQYVLTGRDILGQLVDNASVDASNNIIFWQQASLDTIMSSLVANTRIGKDVVYRYVPNGKFLFQSNLGETKINALQRMLEFANCLIWSSSSGQAIVGKPNFAQPAAGFLLSQYGAQSNNILECRVRRNLNQGLRQVATQLQTLSMTSPELITMRNSDPDMASVYAAGVGRSVYQFFDYGQAGDAVNQLYHVGNQTGAYNSIGAELSRRSLAHENVKALEVEAVVQGHINSSGSLYDIDQVYAVVIDDEKISEPLYTHSVSYELTHELGMITRLHLCRLNTIVSGAGAR